MPTMPVYDMSKKKVGNVDLSDTVFAGSIRPYLINDAVRAQIAWRYEYRTANSLTRSEVQGTRKKMYRQKGTGQARHGDAKAPIFVGGGKAHGPKPRRVRHKINRKVLRAALISALSLNQKEDRLFIVDKFELDKPSTKKVAGCMEKFGLKTALVVNDNAAAGEKNFNESTSNISGIKCIRPEGINVFDVLKYKNLLFSQKAVEKITERLAHV